MKNHITQVKGETLIDAHHSRIWNTVRHFGKIADYHPLVKKSYAINEIEGVGAKRYCQLIPAGIMEEEVTDWQEGKTITAQVTGGKMLPPCHFMSGTLALEPRGHLTYVQFTFSYQMKFGWLGQLLNYLVIKPQFKSAPVKYVNGLKTYLERPSSTIFR